MVNNIFELRLYNVKSEPFVFRWKNLEESGGERTEKEKPIWIWTRATRMQSFNVTHNSYLRLEFKQLKVSNSFSKRVTSTRLIFQVLPNGLLYTAWRETEVQVAHNVSSIIDRGRIKDMVGGSLVAYLFCFVVSLYATHRKLTVY